MGFKEIGDRFIIWGEGVDGSLLETRRVFPPRVESSSLSSTGEASEGYRERGDPLPLRNSSKLMCALCCSPSMICYERGSENANRTAFMVTHQDFLCTERPRRFRKELARGVQLN